MGNYVITFARGFGSGGKEIASCLAKELGIHCYENRILTLASQMSGLEEKLFQEVNEKIRQTGGFSNFMRGLPEPGSMWREKKSSALMTNCLNIKVRSSKTLRIRNPALSWGNAPIISCGTGKMWSVSILKHPEHSVYGG